MNGGDRRGLRLAGALSVAYILGCTGVYVLSRVYFFGLSGRIAWYVALAVPIAALQAAHSSPRFRRPAARYTLPALALLTYVPYLFLGAMWIGLPAFLAGSVLILLRGRTAWVLFAAVVASWALIGRSGYDGGAAASAAYAVLSTANVGVSLYGFSYLAGVVTRVHATRTELADLAVTAERLRAAMDLGRSVGRGLSAIARTSAVAATDGAIAEVVRIARRTLDAARGVAATYRVATRAADHPDGGDAGRAALRILLFIYVNFLVSGLIELASSRSSGLAWAVTLGSLVGILALQLRHTVLRLRGRPIRGRVLTLAAQVVLLYAPLVADVPWFMTIGPVAVSALFLLPGRAGRAAAGLILLSGPVLGGTVAALSPMVNVYLSYSHWVSALAIFGLIWLAELAGELRAARAELARMAVLAERLRVAGDVHDLLGYGLSAITLKAELARRLLPGDPGRARAELADVRRLAHRTLGELRDLTENAGELSLADEIASAREVLSGLGVKVEVRLSGAPAPRHLDGMLATVLREAVTNVLRHSAARRVSIRADGGRLEITNDGVPERPPAPGSGLTGLTSRVEARGGTLTASAGNGSFHLTVEVPVDVPPAGRRPC